MKRLFVLCCLLFALSAFANPKMEEFVQAIVSTCAKTKEQAVALVTPGRSGNFTKFMLCASPSVDVVDGCTVECKKDSGNVVGN